MKSGASEIEHFTVVRRTLSTDDTICSATKSRQNTHAVLSRTSTSPITARSIPVAITAPKKLRWVRASENFLFAGSIFTQAIGGKACEAEFETAAALSDFTGEKIPENIAGLREKPVLHTDVVDIDQLTDYALS